MELLILGIFYRCPSYNKLVYVIIWPVQPRACFQCKTIEKINFQFLKKLWCCVGGRDQNKFLVLSNELIKPKICIEKIPVQGPYAMARAGPEKAVRPCQDHVQSSYGDFINSTRKLQTKTILLLYKSRVFGQSERRK